VLGTSSLSLSFPLSSTVGGGFGTAGFTNKVLEVEGAQKRELHSRDRFCQLGSSVWRAYKSASHQ
jgi:hypothetical protein